MRLPFSTVLVLSAIGLPLPAQEAPPSNLAEIELERSRTCVDVLTRLEALDVELAPLADRAQHLLAIAGAINIEEASFVDSLDVSDPLEAAVRDWFEADARLARQYLADSSRAVFDERAAGRRAIQERVAQAIEEVQAEADSVMATTGTLNQDAAACSGAILVRGAAVEACEGLQSRVCQAARDSTLESPFRFIESPELLWYRQELRPWTAPTPLQVSPQGQLSGARTVGSTRLGNIVISLAVNPLLRQRAQLSPEQIATIDSINAPLGIESTHPELIYAPALSIQATLPRSLDGESQYVVHFGPPDDPDVMWVGEADTGAPLVGQVALAPEHVARFLEGEPASLTAIREVDAEEAEAVYSIELSSVNQVPRIQALLGYMGQRLASDLTRLVPPENP